MPSKLSIRPRGFTLIELMLVIAIIGILATLVVPNLIMSRSASNETAAIAALRAYVGAQVVFKRNDYDMDGVARFTAQFRDLHYTQTAGGSPIKLVAQSFADAGAPESSACGYYYENLTSRAGGNAYDPAYEFGLAALPAKYGRSGINSFVIDCSGVVYQKDRKTGEALGGEYPAITTDGWAASGQ